MSGLKVLSQPVVIDLGYNEIMRNFSELKGSFVEVGLWGDGDDPATNLAARGAVHEYGTQNGRIPSRPWMRQTAEKYAEEVNDFVVKLLESLTDRNISGITFLGLLGAFYEGKMKAIFTEGEFAELAASTIARKGSDTPLIDTGLMRASITSKVFIKNHELFQSFIDAMEDNKISEEAELE